LDPKFVRAFARKGQIYIEKKEFENAFKAYQDGLKIDRNNKECLDGIDCINEEKAKEANRLKQNAEEYAINGNWGPCLENLNKAMQLSPNIGDLYQLKARFLFKMKNYDQAVIEGKRAVELEPYNSKEALQIIGDSLIILKRNEDAVIWLNKALQLDPSNQQLIAKIAKIKEGWTDQLYDKSDAFHKAKNLDLALDYINQALILQPKQIKYLLKKSYILDEKGDKKGALQILASILEIDKTNPDVWLNMKAKQAFEEGLNHEPSNMECRNGLRDMNGTKNVDDLAKLLLLGALLENAKPQRPEPQLFFINRPGFNIFDL
jgi:tetratricopeptide (TPR) repeat protein